MTTRRATDNAKALDAFIAAKFRIDAMLERLKALSEDHFETHHDEINWGDVGTLNHYDSLLRQIADLERDDEGDVIIATDAEGHNDLMSRITVFLAEHDR
ncbi:hypothetical protein EI545_05390 [Tabrizicola piscis]|uniref:Uncharacterized protein n=1 Tax=Tabrizicola piscis TaxID=2494374 RepID=A0A3S8U3W6_9RHOB|nr:hypothetical protein EI545_05390 [Tabrizicola piscis]